MFSPDIIAVEAVDEDIPTKIKEVYGRRRHRHLFLGPNPSTETKEGLRNPRSRRLDNPISREEVEGAKGMAVPGRR